MVGEAVHGLLRWHFTGGLVEGPTIARRPRSLRGLLVIGSAVTAVTLGAATAALVDSLLAPPSLPAPPMVAAATQQPAASPALLPFAEGRSFEADAADARASHALPLAPDPLSWPENSNVAPGFLALRDALARAIADYRQDAGEIEVALAVTDLQTGETISVNGDVLQRSGCTVMSFALLAAVGEFEPGRADPADIAGAISAGIGGSSPPEVYWFLEQVFGDQRLGVARAQTLMRAWGLRQSQFDHVPYYGDGARDNLLTAREMNLVLAKLYGGELFSRPWTDYTLERLRAIKPTLNYILPGALPQEATVAHKIGYLLDNDGHVNSDAGIVTFRGSDGAEKAYAITYLSQQAPSDYAGHSFGAKLSRQVWDYFAAKYQVA